MFYSIKEKHLWTLDSEFSEEKKTCRGEAENDSFLLSNNISSEPRHQ